ncbi:hypothetical protein HHI36_011070 [Cryptolaemus montrouzieri]|uniref:Translation initiation factor eIF2B subunit epsilon n=1 Tax=Cryptolaemus montrouzieri TaxID=559131 RepID=A0ABD2MKS4_9CUCU
MGSTLYLHLVKENQYGGAVTNWQNYQAISWEVQDRWAYPLVPPLKGNRILKNNVVIGENTVVAENANVSTCIFGENVSLEGNTHLENSFIMSNCKIEHDVIINSSVIGPNCTIESGSKIINTVLGYGVQIPKNKEINSELIQARKPDFCEKEEIIGKNAFIIKLDEEDYETKLYKSSLLLPLTSSNQTKESSDEDDGFSDSGDEDLSYTHSPVPDDTKLFFTEVIDSLTRGFEDELQCDNLILEINSSRYAYNVTVKEVNFNVVKAILHMYLRQPTGQRYFSQLLSYFSPILKNYIRNEVAMVDCLQAIQDAAITNEEIKENWVLFVLKWFYSKDHLSEEAILKWGKTLDSKTKFAGQVKPFLEWLEEAEEASSEDE